MILWYDIDIDKMFKLTLGQGKKKKCQVQTYNYEKMFFFEENPLITNSDKWVSYNGVFKKCICINYIIIGYDQIRFLHSVIWLKLLGSFGSENTGLSVCLCVCLCVCVCVSVCLCVCVSALEWQNYGADFDETFQKWFSICLVVRVCDSAH